MRMLRALREFARCLAAATILVALVIAPPWLLGRLVGWPLPTTVQIDDVAGSLGQGSISDAFLFKALAIACWLVWGQVVVCLAVEVVAWARGRTATLVPLAGLLQPIIRQLVVSTTLFIGAMRPAGAAVSLPVHPAVQAVINVPVAATPPSLERPTEQPSCVVQRRDSLWKLAERHLGDGMRWREIYELNRGRAQPGGRSLAKPDLIHPGWTLLLPPDASGPEAQESATSRLVPQVPAQPAAPQTPLAPEPSIPTTTSVASPDPSPTVAPSSPASTPTPVDTNVSTDLDDPVDDEFPVPTAVAGATLLAAGVVITINRLRHRQMRRRRPGRMIPLAKDEAQAAERLLRAGAATKPASRLDLALRLLSHQLADVADTPEARLEVVRVDGDRIEILLTKCPEASPGPFEQIGDRVWMLPAETSNPALDAISGRRTAPAPALATVGHLDGNPVLVDLEMAPLVLTGDRRRAEPLIWSMALELATNIWADDVRVLVVGSLPPGLDGLDRIEVAERLEDLLPDLANSEEAAAEALEDAGQPSRWSARIAGVGDAWSPTIVFVTPGADTGAVPPRGTGFVRWAEASEPETRSLNLGIATDCLEPLGLDLDQAGLDEELLKAAGRLVTTALSDESGEDLQARTWKASATPPGRPSSYPVVYQAPTPPPDPGASDPDRVLVRVLGPVLIEGAKNPVQRRRIKEFIVYLALHPAGVTDNQIMTALWPGETPTRSAFNQTVSRARAALGLAADGRPIVPYVEGCLYRPSRHLISDLHLLEDALTRGLPTGHIQVTREPFAGTDGFEWAYIEGHAHRGRSLVDLLRHGDEARSA